MRRWEERSRMERCSVGRGRRRSRLKIWYFRLRRGGDGLFVSNLG